MAVTVTRPVSPAEFAPTTKHEEGEHLRIVDGHLFVQTHPDQDIDSTIALYAPGKWVSDVVDSEKKST